MKYAFVAVTALALMASTASAAPTKKEVFDLFETHYDCGWSGTVTDEERGKACKAEERAIKKLNAQGYCFVGHGMIGRSGKRMSKYRNHCFYLKEKGDARIMRYIEQYESEQSNIGDRVVKARCKKHPELPACENNGWKGDTQ